MNNPVKNIDPNGMDVWSTTDPEEIGRAIESLLRGGNFQYNSNYIYKSDMTGVQWAARGVVVANAGLSIFQVFNTYNHNDIGSTVRVGFDLGIGAVATAIGGIKGVTIFYQSSDCKLMPFIGIGEMGIGSTDTEIKKYPELDEFKELSTLNYMAGLELKLNSWDRDADLSRTGGLYLGIRYTYYMPDYKRKHPLLEGNMHMITLSFGGFGRPVKSHF